MLSHHPAMFSGHGHCGNGKVTFFVVGEQNFTRSRLNLPLLFFSKANGMLKFAYTKF